MENASKALIMAGSVLMAVLVIGALMFMYNKLADVEQTKTDVEEESKITDYGKRFEQYNKTIYGSELFSLANLQEDYNKTQASEKGYTAITITVKIKNSISETTYFQAGSKDIADILKDKNNIEKEISNYESKSQYKGKTVKYYSQRTNREIATIYGIDFSSDEADYEIGDRLSTNGGEVSKLMNAIEEYKNIKTVYTEFKNKRFKCTKISYDNNGRVNSMIFEEI